LRSLLAARSLGGLTVALLALLSCSDQTKPSSDCFTGKGMPVSVRYPATTPLFVWVADCPASYLYVAYLDGSSLVRVWEIHSVASQNNIHSPVTYGTVPDGAEATIEAFPLVPGRTYKVEVSNWDPVQGGAGYLGLAWFTH